MNAYQKSLSSSLFVLAALLYSPAPGGADGVAPSLGMARSFAVLGASTVTCTGASAVTGDIGVSPGTAITGFPAPCSITGAIHPGDAVAAPAHRDAVTAYNALVDQTCDFNYPPVAVLTNATLKPGVHCFPSSLQVTETLTLDGAGVFIFNIGSTIITAANAQVRVIDDGLTCDGANVFWAVASSATLGTGTLFAGHILAMDSITLTTSADVSGSAIALTAAVTMDTNKVVTCGPPSRRTDVNGDGRADLVWRNTTTGTVRFWLQDGFTILDSQMVREAMPLGWQIAGVGDVNGDERADLVWRHRDTGTVRFWLQDGFTILDSQMVREAMPLGWQIAGVGDVNGDGRADLVWRHRDTGTVRFWLQDGFTILDSQMVREAMPLGWQIAGVGDVNGDGRADLVWRHRDTGTVRFWLQDGFTILDSQVVREAMPLGWQIAGVGDVNGDGRADLVWRHRDTGTVRFWLQDGFTILDSQVVREAMPLGWQIAGVGDVNGDGRADLVWRHRDTGTVRFWLQDGFTILDSQVVREAMPLEWTIVKGEE